MLQRFLHNRTAMFTVAIVLLTALVGIFAPFIAPNDPYERISSTNLPDFRLNIRLERTTLAAAFFRE